VTRVARVALAAGALGVAACAGPAPGSEPVPRALDRAAYVRDVHPIVEARCATLDCHGRFERPLRLYAETGLRRSDELRELPITDVELDDNVAAATAVDAAATPDDSLILMKPLGRMKHTGGTLWPTATNPQYLCVRGWLAGTSDRADVAAACLTAADQVKLPPP
jgi:hypothetical protein